MIQDSSIHFSYTCLCFVSVRPYPPPSVVRGAFKGPSPLSPPFPPFPPNPPSIINGAQQTDKGGGEASTYIKEGEQFVWGVQTPLSGEGRKRVLHQCFVCTHAILTSGASDTKCGGEQTILPSVRKKKASTMFPRILWSIPPRQQQKSSFFPRVSCRKRRRFLVKCLTAQDLCILGKEGRTPLLEGGNPLECILVCLNVCINAARSFFCPPGGAPNCCTHTHVVQ